MSIRPGITVPVGASMTVTSAATSPRGATPAIRPSEIRTSTFSRRVGDLPSHRRAARTTIRPLGRTLAQVRPCGTVLGAPPAAGISFSWPAER
jgi:hypothetical protein